MNAPLAVLFASTVLLADIDAQKLRNAQPAPGDPGREVHMYDVRDLVESLASAQPDRETQSDAQRAQARTRVLQACRRCLTTFVEPPLAAGEEIKVLGDGMIVALARAEQQAWITAWLRLQRERAGHMLLLEARVARVTAALARELGVDEKPEVLAAGEAADEFRAKLNADPATEMLTAPRLLTYPLQNALIQAGSQVAYIADWKIEIIEPGKREIADPTIKTVFDGVQLEGYGAWIGADRIGLSCKIEIAELQRPMPTKQIELRPGRATVEIALPEIERATVETTCVVPAGGTVAYPGPLFEGKRVLILLTAKPVE